ncbi:Dgcr14 protein [Salpingoeca rosetta]|uniref:Dgcr14 protein n=1 Tax=Salpingoeca rosetta (strain ATCC 50818 / BSB-021) TaxID=946362 RepID=F2US30_SALR5|nr:Dgcr14 protein [Salpingoeca rosetta]EGD80435.1 Dgcr14 protein [Salpingoeca rosetta]|eukprot:XP_004987999.1 Dgcr14 protein [Salpingoeca rosetta]
MSRSMTARSKELISSLPPNLVEAIPASKRPKQQPAPQDHSNKDGSDNASQSQQRQQQQKTTTSDKATKEDGNKTNMQLQTRDASKLTLAVPGQQTQRRKKKKLVLEEDEYVSALEKIIQRDFFPDLPMLQAQADYLDALESNDLDRMREIKLRFQTPAQRRSGTNAVGTAAAASKTRAAKRRAQQAEPFNTPLTTPQRTDPDAADAASDTAHTSSSGAANLEDTPGPATRTRGGVKDAERRQQHRDAAQGEGGRKGVDTSLSLNQFLNKYTSEDNASFEKIIEDTNERMAEQYRKYYGEVSAKSKLALEQAQNDKPLGLGYEIDTWRYVPRNALMYGPQSQALTAADLIRMSDEQRTRINHHNTRFTRDPYAGRTGTVGTAGTRTRSTLGGGAGGVGGGKHVVDLAARQLGQPGVDGDAGATPQVNGYKLVATPSPMPGRDMDPLMTWGEIEGTPFRLDAGSSVPATPGPVFNIPPLKPREQVARDLADKATRSKRKSKQQHQQQHTSSRHASAARGVTPTTAKASERLRTMTPAAQRLAQTLWGRTGTTPARTSSSSSSSSSTLSSSRRATPSLNAALRSAHRGQTGSKRATPLSSYTRRTPAVTPVATPKGAAAHTPVTRSRDDDSVGVGEDRTSTQEPSSITDNLL